MTLEKVLYPTRVHISGGWKKVLMMRPLLRFVWANWSERFTSGCRTGTMNLNPSSGKPRPTSSSTRCAAARKPLQRIRPDRRLVCATKDGDFEGF